MSTIKTFGTVDQRSLEQLKRCMEAGDAEFGVLCADHHPGYSQPIGGGIAYEGYVSPSGVGYDIGCGNKAARTELTRADLDALGGVEAVMGEITRRISFGMGVPAAERTDHPVLDGIRNADFAPQRKLAQLAESQLGTVGSGNHYVNLMEDEDGRIWVGVHFGSRGFGHKTASGFLALAQGLPFDGRATEGEMDSPPVLFEVGSRARRGVRRGDGAGGRVRLCGPRHRGRQGARDPRRRGDARGAQPPQLRVAGGALRPQLLGDPEGLHAGPPGPGGLRRRLDGRRVGDPRGRRVGRERAGALLDRARRRPRDEPLAGGRPDPAAQALRLPEPRLRSRLRHRRHQLAPGLPKKGVCPDHPESGVMKVWVQEQLKPGLVDWPAVQARLREQGIVLVGGGADEAPEVYKRLPEVLAAHGDSMRVKHTLRPLGVAMAGRDVHDPYKD